MFAFYTDVLNRKEEEFWELSMRRWWALFLLNHQQQERMKKEQDLAKQNKALEQMRSL